MGNIKCTKDSDRNHSALRTSKQHEKNKMTDVSSRYYTTLFQGKQQQIYVKYSHIKKQSVVANVRAKTKYVSTQREQICC